MSLHYAHLWVPSNRLHCIALKREDIFISLHGGEKTELDGEHCTLWAK